MHIPVVSSYLYRRKGGGGKGGGSSGGKSGGSSGGKSGGGSGSGGKTGSSGPVGSKGSHIPVSGSTGKGSTGSSSSSSATAYGSGGGRVSTIPSGSPFSGRTVGGGTRSQVYGTGAYGSGYPGLTSRGVGGRGFPFVFWPVIWGGALGYGGAYLHNQDYGNSSNPQRPGGPMVEATFTSPTSNSTFHLLSDNSTITSLIGSLNASCALGPNTSTVASAYNSDSADPLQPRPEQVIQYYRASSVALTLDGYNDTSVLSDNQTSAAPDVPIPSWVDQTTLNCLNQTIGQAVPLVDGVGPSYGTPAVGVLGLVWMLYALVVMW